MDGPPLARLFEPRSIAFVGASAAQEKIGGRRWRSLLAGGFRGRAVPVHPRAREVLGVAAVASVADLPEAPDLVVVAVAPEHVPGVVDDCARKGAGAVMVITGGFGETGPAGRELERAMAASIRAAGGRLVGPNCAALFSAPARVDIGGWRVPPGDVGLVSQSGNVAIDFARLAEAHGGGFSRAITVGNAADVGTADVLRYLLHDDATRVALVYVEGFRDGEGRTLVDLVRDAGGRKPVVMVKPGRNEAGRRAALSHTGALAGDDAIVEAALAHAGVVRAGSVEDAWNIARALASRPATRALRVAVLTDGGGHGTLAGDALGSAGFAMPAFAAETRERLAAMLPPRCPIDNPVDFAGEAEGAPSVVARALDVVLGEPTIDAAVIAGHFGGYHLIAGPSVAPLEADAARELAQVAAAHGKPVLVHSLHGDRDLPALEALRGASIPVFRHVEAAARTLAGVRDAAGPAPDDPDTGPAGVPQAARALLGRAVGDGPRWLREPDARELLAHCGVAMPPHRVAGSSAECAGIVASFGVRCALKVVSDRVVHKSDVDGVVLDVDPSGAAPAFDALQARLAQRGLRGAVLVTPMIDGDLQCVVGALRDRAFGPFVMVGAGGTRVELHRDVRFAPAPIGPARARALLRTLRVAPLLDGYRGRPPLDLEGLARIVCAVGRIVAAIDDIDEIDLNPVIVGPGRASVADARIVLRPG